MPEKKRRRRSPFGNVRKYDRLAALCAAGKKHPRFVYSRKHRLKAWRDRENHWRFEGNDVGAMLVGLYGDQAIMMLVPLKAGRGMNENDAFAELLGISAEDIALIERNLPQGLGLYGALRVICHMTKRRHLIPLEVSKRSARLENRRMARA